MLDIFRGPRPDISPAMLGAFLLAGIPVLANFGRAFGLYDLSKDGEEALKELVQWAVIGGLGLIAGDAYLRGKRNDADAKVQAAALAPAGTSNVATDGGTVVSTSAPTEPADTEALAAKMEFAARASGGEGGPVPEAEEDEGLPSDEEEFASQPPSDGSGVRPDKP